ncbi:PGF-CTERM sorting domain-containing protein [Halococcoides cellulosivorans]|nr:PGF-CTERM sorting domain-containing protein [Halococcoides cellulosivorans]
MNDFDATIRRAGVVLVAVLAVVGGIGVAVGAPLTAPPPSSEVTTAAAAGITGMGDDVGVWGRAPLTLRADDSMAQDTIPVGAWIVDTTEYPDKPMGVGPIGVYDTGQPVDVTFDAAQAEVSGSTFANETLTVYAVAGESPIDPNTTSASSLDGLNASETGGVSRVDTTTIGADGSATVNYVTNETGTVQFVAVLSDDPSGGLAANATVVGLDSVLVRSTPSAATAPESVDAGENLTMNVDAGGTGTAGHAVVLYDEATMADSTVTVRVTNSSAVTIEPEIDRLNATTRTSNGSVESTSIDIASLMGSLGGISNTSLYADGSPNETVVLDGAAAVTTGPANTTLDIPTSESMATGEYRWVYVGATSDSSSVATGSVEIASSTPATPTPTTPTPTTTTPAPTTTTEADDDDGGSIGGGGRVPIDPETTTVAGGGAEPRTPVTTTTQTTTAEPTTTAATTTERTFARRTPTSSGGPGFGAVLALVALVAVALLGLRRR